jgi:aurora kinase
MAEVSNLEAAFERITVNDENDEQVVSYHKAKVDTLFALGPSCP